jgi:hypothetical protein
LSVVLRVLLGLVLMLFTFVFFVLGFALLLVFGCDISSIGLFFGEVASIFFIVYFIISML